MLTAALSSVFARGGTIESPSVPLSAANILEYLGGAPAVAGPSVTNESALKVPAVWACIRVLAEDVAMLPLHLYRRVEEGKRLAIEHPLYALLHDAPNPWMTAFQLREMMMLHLLSWGNFYAEIQRGPDGRPVALWPLVPSRMLRPEPSAGGTLLYPYRPPNGPGVKIPQRLIWHIRGMASDGLVGYSPIALHRETIGLSMAQKEFSARFIANNARPSGVITLKGRLSDDALDRISHSWDTAHGGLSKSARLAFLEEGMEYQPSGMPLTDAQFVEGEQITLDDIPRVFRVPPHKIGNLVRATYSNIQFQDLAYATDSLQPWCERIEQQGALDLLLESERRELVIEHSIDARLRGDPKTRAEARMIQRQNGILSANEWRNSENMNALPEDQGGDDYWMPANMLVVGDPRPEPAAAAPAEGASARVREITRTAGGFRIVERDAEPARDELDAIFDDQGREIDRAELEVLD